MQYRILTEDKNRDRIEEIVCGLFDSFTIIPCLGYWQGNSEKSLIIVIDCSATYADDYLEFVRTIAKLIIEENQQACVLIEKIRDIEAEFA
jgi:hypothetical protein